MDDYERVVAAIFDALRELNEQSPGEEVPVALDTPLMGAGGQLSSLAIVTLATVTEENLDRAFDQSVSVMDVLMAVDADSLDVTGLAHRIARRLGCAVPE